MNPDPTSRGTWMAWGAVVTVVVMSAGVLGTVVVGWPPSPWWALAGALPFLPLGWFIGRGRRWAPGGHRVLVATVVLSGMLALIGVLFVVVVVVFGRRPAGDERLLYALCLGAAVVASGLSFPARGRLRRWALAVVPDERTAPERVLATFATRLTRSVPMDELLLQVVEALHVALASTSVEMWTGEDGELALTASVPERRSSSIRLDSDVRSVAARAGAQGNAWMEMWLPELARGRTDRILRSVPIPYQGELLGLVVIERSPDREAFTPAEDRMLIDLSRQLGLALHNLRLDSALRASIGELERSNAELSASRSRLVTAADESRRHIERNLHDGTQQHLVALAIQIGLIRSLLDAGATGVEEMFDELAAGVDAAIVELRDVAHGIYPPRLRDRGLADAITVAAQRSGRPTLVEADGVARYSADIEAAVYFCCLEAVQNATKYAGDDPSITILLSPAPGSLELVVTDDGVGFDPVEIDAGQGITNMRDRIGAVGGELTIDSMPGHGTTVRAVIPARPLVDDVATRPHAATPE